MFIRLYIICISFFLSVGLVTSANAATKQLPYKGRINGSRVNVRGSNSLKADVLTQLKRGVDVTVIDEKDGWSKIIMPYGISTWVYASLIKDNLVNRDKINVRSGPAVHYSVLAKLKRGDVVKIIDEADGWVKITPPAGVGGWMASQYITFLASSANYDDWLKGEKEAKSEFEKLELFRKKEMFKEIHEVDFNLIIKKYSAFIKEYSAYPESLTAKERIVDAQEKKKKAQVTGSYVEHSPAATTVSQNTTTQQDTFSARKVSYVGKIKKLKKTTKTADYYLRSGGLFGGAKCYIVSNDFNISTYVGRRVTIVGHTLDDDKKPLVNVTDIVIS